MPIETEIIVGAVVISETISDILYNMELVTALVGVRTNNVRMSITVSS